MTPGNGEDDDAGDADHDSDPTLKAYPFTEEQRADEGGEKGLGACVGGADRKVPEREQIDEQHGSDDLSDTTECRISEEGRIERRQALIGPGRNACQIDGGEGQAE